MQLDKKKIVKRFILFALAIISLFAAIILIGYSLKNKSSMAEISLHSKNCKFTIKLRIDDKFSTIERSLIAVAAKQWMVASSGQLCFKIKSDTISISEFGSFLKDGKITIYSGKYLWQHVVPWVYYGCHGPTECMAITVGHIINRAPDVFFVDRTRFLEVATHELGHVIGIRHSPNIKDMMYPNLRHNTNYITKNDIKVLQCIIKNNMVLKRTTNCNYRKAENL